MSTAAPPDTADVPANPEALAAIFALPLVGLGEVRLIAGLQTRQLAWHAVRRPTFPEPAGTIAGARVWWTREVVTWAADHSPGFHEGPRKAWKAHVARERRRIVRAARHGDLGGPLEDV